MVSIYGIRTVRHVAAFGNTPSDVEQTFSTIQTIMGARSPADEADYREIHRLPAVRAERFVQYDSRVPAGHAAVRRIFDATGREDARVGRDRSPHGEGVRELDVRPTLGESVDCAEAGVIEDILQILHARKVGAREPSAFRAQTEAAKACAAGSDSRRNEWIP